MTEYVSLSYNNATEGNANTRQSEYGGTIEKYTVFRPCNGKFSDIFKIVENYAWSPIVFIESYRRAANFKFADLIGLDFDDGSLTLKEAIEWVKDNDYAAFIGTTKSHQILKINKGQVCDRFRIILRTAETCRDVETYEYTLKLLTKEMKADPSCKDAARFFFRCKTTELLNLGKNRINWVTPPIEETASYKNVIARVTARTEWRDESKIPTHIWGHIFYGCRPPGRHKLCYILGAHLGLRGFSTEEIMAMLSKNKSPLLQIGHNDAARAIKNGLVRAIGDSPEYISG